jgi:site-specific DNA recombinase
MKKAILYIRVSTDEQAERGHSLAYQEEKLKLYCQLKGIEVMAMFKEDHSAKSFERPQIKSLLTYLRKNRGLIDTMLFIKWDRFSRNAGDAYAMIKTLHKLGVEPYATEQPLDLTVPKNKTMLALYLTIPEVENDRRSLNVNSGMRRARREGRFLGVAPVGYLNKRDANNKPVLMLDPIQAPLVKRGFEEALKCIKPIFTIFQELKAEGFKCSKSNFWRVLTNPIYYGGVEIPAFRDEKYEVVKGIHEPIITKEMFDTINDILYNKKRVVPVNNLRREKYPLRGNLKCNECAGLLTASKATNRHGSVYHYYHCQTNGCKVRFKAEVANAELLELLKRIKPSKADLKVFQKESNLVFAQNEQDKKQKLGNVESAISKAEERLKNAQNLLLDGTISGEDYKGIKANIETEINELKKSTLTFATYDNELTRYIQHATQTFENLDSAYVSANLEIKSRLLGWIFPKKIELGNSDYPTLFINPVLTLISPAAKGLAENKNGISEDKLQKSHPVIPLGLEPRAHTLKVYCSTD